MPKKVDCAISAAPTHAVADLALALAHLRDRHEGKAAPPEPDNSDPPELWLGDTRLDPAAPIVGTGIRDGSWLGIGAPTPAGGDRRHPSVAEIRVVAGPDSGLIVRVGPGRHLVSRDGGDVALSDVNVTRKGHCAITIAAGPAALDCTVENLDTKNGTGVEGHPVGGGPAAVRPGQLIGVGSSLLTITLPEREYAVVQPGDDADPLGRKLNRPPRMPAGAGEQALVDFAAEPARRQRLPSWLTALIAPAVSLAAGGVFVAITGQWLFLLLGIGGIAVPVVTQVTSHRGARRSWREEQREFTAASAAAEHRLADLLEVEQQRRRDEMPDPAHVLAIASGPGTRLWERLPVDEDFMRIRVGWADLPADSVEVRAPARQEASPDPIVRCVPAAVALPLVGVFGVAAERAVGQALLAWLCGQIAVLHSPADVQLVLLTDDPGSWQWIRWLPHIRPLPGSEALAAIGTDAGSCKDRAAELRKLVRDRHGASATPSSPDGRPGQNATPAVVVLLDGSYRLRQLPGLDAVLADGPAVGVYLICLDDERNQLPRQCQAELVIDRTERGKAMLRDQRSRVRVDNVDSVRLGWAEQVARCLASIRDTSVGGQDGLPDVVRLLDLWGLGPPTPSELAARWSSGGRTTVVPLGRIQTGPFVLDIARDGPHMLVAGMTGAGKSEFLQALVASLAIGNQPDALVFILIDYKGGSAFAGCRKLPHVVGYLTDLDEHLALRVLKALAAEVEYRERLLADAESKDIVAYHAAGQRKGPLPRLVLAIDEFKFMAEKMPEFVARLADVAARGRSLGIHLVLATQRPGGVVTGDIRTNMGLRVCFKVEDSSDSAAVIDVIDAALIERRLRGRGYARIERGYFALFQGAYVGGLRPDLPAELVPLSVVERPFKSLGEAPRLEQSADEHRTSDDLRTDLAALVHAMDATGFRPPPHRPWLEPLPDLIPISDVPLERPGGHLLPALSYGLQDRPDLQTRQQVTFRLDDGGHLLAVGAAQSGRTTLLRTIAARLASELSPGDAHLYVLDCDAGGLAPMARLPHCGAFVRRTERERAARLLDRLVAELSRRHDLIADHGFGSVAEQRKSVPAADRLPYLVLLIDRWEGFLADLGQFDNGRLPDLVYRLLNEGASAGLRVIITGDRTALARLPNLVADRLVFRMAEPGDLMSAGAPKNAMPADPPPGRAIKVPAGVEVQVAFAGANADGAQQTAALDVLINDAIAAHPVFAPVPFRVDQLPRRISYDAALSMNQSPTSAPLRPVIAVGGDELGALTIDLAKFPGFAIAGPPLSGRSTAIVVAARSLLRGGASVICFAPRESPLQRLAGEDAVIAMFDSVKADLAELARLLETTQGPLAVLVDDAEALYQAPVAEALVQVPTEGRTREHALVIAATSSELIRMQRGFTAAARQFRCGLLLTPEAPQLGLELFGARLPKAAFDGPPGRGYLIRAGQAVLVQVPELP